jgi:hypothetical protein
VSGANIIIFVTKEARLYEKYGLDAEVVTVNGSGISSRARHRRLDVQPEDGDDGFRLIGGGCFGVRKILPKLRALPV